MPLLAEHLERQSVMVVESTIPGDMTIAEWRTARKGRRAPCDHLHETTSRYDAERTQLTFLMVCPMCHTERVVHTMDYEPDYKPVQVLRPTRRPQPTAPASPLERLAA
jgi:hypothetical protein